MPTPVKYIVLVLVGIGLGTITWGVGGLMQWSTPLVQGGDVVGVSPGDVSAFVVDGQLTAEQGGGEAQGELLADFTVGERDNMVGVGVEADQTGDFDVETVFLFNFAYSGVCDGFADVVPTTR